jgi:hypothetical protein
MAGRMEAVLAAAAAKLRESGHDAEGLEHLVADLDERFLSELCHTARLFDELFEPTGRRALLKVARQTHLLQRMRFAWRACIQASHVWLSDRDQVPCSGCQMGPSVSYWYVSRLVL